MCRVLGAGDMLLESVLGHWSGALFLDAAFCTRPMAASVDHYQGAQMSKMICPGELDGGSNSAVA